jgi:hypothetical protein
VKLQDQLTLAANRMRMLGQDNGAVEYVNRAGTSYVVVAAPAGTRRAELGQLAELSGAVDVLDRCLSSQEAVLAILSANWSDCVHPVSFPEIRTLIIASKARDDRATAQIKRAANGAFELVAIE